MVKKIDYLDPNISNGDEKISSKELRQLEYLRQLKLSKLKQDTKHDLKDLYFSLLKQKEAYDTRKKKSEYIIRLEKEVLAKLKKVISSNSSFLSTYKLDTNILFSDSSSEIQLDRSINLMYINKKILHLFRKHWANHVPLIDLIKFKKLYFQALYNEVFDGNWNIKKKLLPVVKNYFLFKKTWEAIFQKNLSLVVDKNIAKKLPIIGYVESYFWLNNRNSIAKGPFQFTDDSGVTYGLVKRKNKILISDYRNDPIKAAEATSKHLRDIFIYRLLKSHKLSENDVIEYKKVPIKPGDTFVKFAEAYDVNIRLIKWFNEVKRNKTDKLIAGKYLYIPTKLKDLSSKVNADDLFFVLSMYNGGLVNRLKVFPKDMSSYITTVKNIYLEFFYYIKKATTSSQLKKYILFLNHKYFKKGHWLFTCKSHFIRKLRRKSLKYKKNLCLDI